MKRKKRLSASAKKFIEDQKFIREYLIGRIKIEELYKRGIKIFKPVKQNLDSK